MRRSEHTGTMAADLPYLGSSGFPDDVPDATEVVPLTGDDSTSGDSQAALFDGEDIAREVLQPDDGHEAALRVGGLAVDSYQNTGKPLGDVDSEYYPEPFKAYQHDLRRFPLLSPEQEVELGKRIKAGDRLARNELVEGNLRLVVPIARHYMPSSLGLIDLIQAGNIGVIRAAEKFDWEKGFKFSTYATAWIRSSISREIQKNAHTVCVPPDVTTDLNRMYRVSKKLAVDLGREPTDAEVAAEMGVDEETFADLQWAKFVQREPESLNKPRPKGYKDDEGSSLGDLLPDPNAQVELEHAEAPSASELRDMLGDIIKPKEWQVLSRRYGLGGGNAWTLLEVSKFLGVTKERVRQIEARAISKIKAHPEILRRMHS